MHPTPLQRLVAAVPPVLLIGLLISLAGETAVNAYQAHLINVHDNHAAMLGWARSNVLSTTEWITTTVLVALGLHEVARRVPRRDHGLVLAAAILIWIASGRAVLSIYIHDVAHVGESTWALWFRWGARASFACWCGASMLLVVALRGRDPLVIAGLAAWLIAAAVLNHPPAQSMYAWFFFDFGRADQWRNAALEMAYTIVEAGALIVTVYQLGQATPPPAGDTHRVADGIGRIGTALVARIVIAMGFVFFMLLAVGAKSPGLARLALVGAPAAGALAMIAMITGMFSGGGNAGATAPPRYRFALAGALTLASTVMIALQAIAAYRLVRQASTGEAGDSYEHERLATVASSFPYLGPAIALAGLLCLISALASLRRQRGPALGSADPTTAAALVIACAVGAAAIARSLSHHGADSGTYLMLLIVVTVTTIIGQLAVARLCHKVADGLLIEAPGALPAARIHHSDEA